MPRRKTTSLRAAPILSALGRHGVDFVTIGSYGAILQNVDLPMTDIDIVPKDTHENRRRLVSALDELDARELVGDTEENIDELRSDPDSMGDSIFRTFVTGFGELDVVLRPAGFPNGYEDLIVKRPISNWISGKPTTYDSCQQCRQQRFRLSVAVVSNAVSNASV